MKHAIILLSSYGRKYLEEAVRQFENDDRFDLYIHLDYKSDRLTELDKEAFRNEFTNVVWINHLYACERFSAELAYVMIDMLEIAWKSGIRYDYYHIFSDSCRILVSIDTFFKWFENEENAKDYIVKYNTSDIDTDEFPNLWKASQWQTFSYNFIDYFFKNNIGEKAKELESIKTQVERLADDTRNLAVGALDEFLFPTAFEMLMRDSNLTHLNIDLRYVNWFNEHGEPVDWDECLGRPYILSTAIRPIRFVIGLIDKIKKGNYLIARKFDCMDNNSMAFLKIVKSN